MVILYIAIGLATLIVVLFIFSKIRNRDKGIFALIADGDINGIKEMVTADPNILKGNKPNGETPVMAAIRVNRPDLLTYMEGQGISTISGGLMLYAIKKKSPKTFSYIFTTNTQTKTFDISKSYLNPSPEIGEFYPIALAAAQKDKAMFYTLLEAGAELNFKKGLERIDTPIHFAVREDNMEMVKILIEKGAKLNTADHAGLSPLHWAAVAGNEEMTLFLLKHGADRAFKGDIGKTPYDYCKEHNSYICVKHLYVGVKK